VESPAALSASATAAEMVTATVRPAVLKPMSPLLRSRTNRYGTKWFDTMRRMPGNGRRRGRRQRDELALAAADWVIEHGLGDLSLRRLAAGLGVSHRVLLYHFGSKDELFQAILRAARTRERLRAVSPPEAEDVPASTHELLRGTWEYLSGPREHAFWRFYFEIHGLALQNPDRYPDVLHEGVHDWLTTLRGLLVRDGVPSRKPARSQLFSSAPFGASCSTCSKPASATGSTPASKCWHPSRRP